MDIKNRNVNVWFVAAVLLVVSGVAFGARIGQYIYTDRLYKGNGELIWNFANGDLPVSGATVIVSKGNDGYTYVRWWNGTVLYKSNDGHDDDDIQAAIDAVAALGGGVVHTEAGVYTNVHLNITQDVPLILDFGISKIKGDGINPVIYIKTKPSSRYYPVIQGGIIENNQSSVCIEVVDSYHVVLKPLKITNCSVGILAKNQEYWTESLIIDTFIENVNVGIKTENNGSIYKSFAQARWNVDINQANYGIWIGQSTSVYRSIILATVWGNTGMYINGSLTYSDIYFNYDGTGTAIEIGNGATRIVFGGDIDPLKISNPYGKEYEYIPDSTQIIVPSGVWAWPFQIKTDNGTTIFRISKQASDEITFNIWQDTLTIYDPRVGAPGGLRVGNLIVENWLKLPTSAPATPQAGDMYFNATTNTLYIYNGTTWVSTVLN